MAREATKVRGVYQKDSGSGEWWIRYADATGRIRREKVGPKGAAIKLYAKRKTQVLEGKKLPEQFRAKPVTFAELAKATIAYSKTNKMSYRVDVIRMAKLLGWLGNRAAESIRAEEIERWLAEQSTENRWKPATANRYKALLSLTFRLAVQNGKIRDNPARLVRRRREDNQRIRFLSHDEEQRLRRVLVRICPERIPEFDIALNTGMRKGEQYGLTWDCIDFERRLLTIQRSKNGQMRHVPLNTVALAAFEKLYGRSSATGRVFLNERGDQPINGPRYWFEQSIRLAHIQDFTWHGLRHTFASRLVMKGVDIRTVQQLMGHKTLQMTCRYAHLAPEHQLAAVQQLCETEGVLDQPTDTRTDTSQSEQLAGAPTSIQ